MPTPPDPIAETRQWLSDVVIGHNFCPFAKREFDQDRILYSLIETDDVQEQLLQIIGQCAAMDRDGAAETSLLIFPSALSDFDDYLDVLDIANALLVGQGYEGIYQLASFHPDYRFAGVEPDDPSHYTNRSPYPMVHILREASIEAALAKHPDPEAIPARNIQVARALGLPTMQALLANCYR